MDKSYENVQAVRTAQAVNAYPDDNEHVLHIKEN